MIKNFVKYLAGNFGKFLRNIFHVKLSRDIYKSLGFYGVFSVSLNKTKITFHNFRDEISNDIFYSGIFGNYEGFSLKIWSQLCLEAKKSYVLDIGGYSGVYSLVAASANNKINIQTYEPHPNTFNWLKKNINSNKFKNININNFALSHKDGDLVFYNSKGENPSGFSAINHSFIEKDAGTMICKAKNVNNLLQKNLTDMKISLIKIDIERAELSLLRLIIKRIVLDKTIILCEILDKDLYPKFDELFTPYGYESILIDDKNYQAKRVKNLKGESKIGRNVLFLPSEFNFNLQT